MPPRLASRLVCQGCGFAVPAETSRPFRCPRAQGDGGVDHLLRKVPEPADATTLKALTDSMDASGGRPFLDFRRFSHVYHRALEAGLDDRGYVQIVDRLEDAIARVDGKGFRTTPLAPAEDLSRRLGLARDARVWVKDETENVAGSHKGRHLMGLLLWLEAVETDRPDPLAPRQLGIASCGNAALAAAVLARAAGWPLQVFLPPDAHPNVFRRLSDLEANLTVCPRSDPRAGDPCHRRFRDRADAGEILPFTCQGTENGLVVDGGETLAYEIVAALRAEKSRFDTLFLQVGGGALASATIQGLRTAVELGLLSSLPRIHAVQTAGVSPLLQAWRGVARRLLQQFDAAICPPPTDAASDARCARLIDEIATPEQCEEALRHAATHRAAYMVPWSAPAGSVASGILDDETYDWLAVVEGMLETGGWPLAVGEERLTETHRLARQTTGIVADPTGTAGLAGLAELLELGLADPQDTHAVLFTGAER